VGARNALYDGGVLPVRRLPVPVLSVGNIAVGGTGKTPLVALLAQRLAETGRRPAVISRGYGGANEQRPGHPALVVSDGRGRRPLVTAAEAGDEPVLLASLLDGVPVLVCRDRHAGGRSAVDRFQADLIVLDDGFQHRALHRDADLVALDARDPLGGGRLLPAGTLREPPQALRRAHAVVLTRAERAAEFTEATRAVRELVPGLPLFRARHQPVRLRLLGPDGRELPASAVRNQAVAGFAGLAQPDALRLTLESLGGTVVHYETLPDHHPYSSGEVERLVERGRHAGAHWVVTTAKDAIRLPQNECPPGLAVLDIEMQVEETDSLVRLLLAFCLPPASRPGPRR
jgi:tetraacyldisaccharide 4'-kinase